MEKAMAPHSSTLAWKPHGWRSLVGCRLWGHKELDMTERLHFHFSLSCIGEGNGKPFQCSCLENPRDGGAWWAAVYGVTQSRTQLKRLSSSSNRTTACQASHPDPASKATLWVKAQHEGALPPPCIVRKDPRVPHTARRGA